MLGHLNDRKNMKYKFFVGKSIQKVNFLPGEGFSIDFGKSEHFECHTKVSVSNENYDLQKIVGKKIIDIKYEKDVEIIFYFNEVSLSFSLKPELWLTPEDVVYKDYRDSERLIIEIIA